MRNTRSMLLATVALLAATALPARAADVTSAQAFELEGQLRTWLGGLLGPAVALGARPVQLSAAGGHFDVLVPTRPPGSDGPIDLTATARPLVGGRWSIQDIRLPPTMTFTMAMPVPPPKGAPHAPPHTETVRLTAHFDQTSGQMQLDPSFMTPTSWTSSGKAATVHAEANGLTQDSSIGATSSTLTIAPAGPDRVDVNAEGTLQDYHLTTQSPDTPPIEAAFHMIRTRMALNGLNRARATTIAQSIAGFYASVLATPPAPGAAMPKFLSEFSTTMLGALHDLAAGMEIEESFDGLAVKYGPMEGGMKTVRVGFGAKSDKGMLQARLDLGLQGPMLPDLHLGGAEALIPQRIEIRPMVSGIGVAELMSLLTAASQNRTPSAAEIGALFGHGGIAAGIESMAIDVAGATFSGQGQVLVATPQDISGTAHVSAANFDALMEAVSHVPQMAQAVPVLVFAKGIGRTVQDRLVWDISYDGGRILVNKVDLSAMMGGGKGPKRTP